MTDENLDLTRKDIQEIIEKMGIRNDDEDPREIDIAEKLFKLYMKLSKNRDDSG